MRPPGERNAVEAVADCGGPCGTCHTCQKVKPCGCPTMNFLTASIPQKEVDRALAAYVEDFRKRPEYYARLGMADEAQLLEQMGRLVTEGQNYVSADEQYRVHVRALDVAGWPPMVHLSIKRTDREPIRDWRVMQQIKNELVGPECEGVELYPAESRLVDAANQYHLWAIATPGERFPFGFDTRLVDDTEVGGSKQRPR